MSSLVSRWYLLLQPVLIVVLGMFLPFWMTEMADESGWQRGLIVFAFAFASTVLLVPVVKVIAERLRVVDEPDPRKVHTVETALWGGAAIYISVLASVYLVGIYYPKIRWLMLALTLLTLTGMVDDYKGLSALFRLTVQIVATALVMQGDVVLTFMPGTWWGRAVEVLLTALWIIGITNAFNFLDGYDGLASGVALVAAFSFGAIGLKIDALPYGQIAFALAGGCLGFLLFNFRVRGRAEIFLGDGGSTLLGFTIGSLAVMGAWASDQWVSLSIPLIILFVPIYDMFLITFGRIYEGKVHSFREWIEYTGRDHFHHRVADLLGGSKRGVVAIWLLTALFGVDCYVLIDSPLSDALLMIGKYAMVFAVLSWILVFRKKREQAPPDVNTEEAADASLLQNPGIPGAKGGRSMKRGSFFFLLSALVVVPVAARADVSKADAADGKAAYQKLCVGCHGPEGKGDGPAAKTLPVKPADHSDPAKMCAMTDEQLLKTIKDGGAAVGKSPIMPAWGAQIKPDDKVWNVIAFIRSLNKQGCKAAAKPDAGKKQ